jgi:hypothetical protein
MNANGQTESHFNVLSQPVLVVFHPNTKNTLALYPQWTVTFYLDKVYPGNVNSITRVVGRHRRNSPDKNTKQLIPKGVGCYWCFSKLIICRIAFLRLKDYCSSCNNKMANNKLENFI